MNDCFSTTGYGTKASLRVETTALSFSALPYHQLDRVDFDSVDGTDTVVLSFVTCTVRVTGKSLQIMARQIAKQEVESINTLPKNTPKPEKHSAWIDKIEVVERKEQAE